jgi:Colicin V production protein
VLGFGAFRGRKNGLTKEILPAAQWLVIVVAAALAYGLVAQFYSGTCGLDKLWSAVLGYVSIAIVVFVIFSAIKKALMPRLEGSSIFGSAEYYLAVPAGIIRYACILIFALALINAKHYTPAEIAAKKAYNERWYGGGTYSGDYIPDLHTVQDAVFKGSLTGPYIHDYASVLLIQTGPDAGGPSEARAGGGNGSAPQKAQPVIHIGN